MRERIAYQPGDSLLHVLHPLVKGMWLVVITILLFVVQQPWVPLGLLGLAIAAAWHSNLRLIGRPGWRTFVVTALVLGVVQLLFNRDGSPLVTIGGLTVTTGGVRNAVYVSVRFLDVVLLSYLFVLTTDPNDLAYGLMQIGLPYRYGFALVTAIRLVPIFEREAQTVYNAQRARGIGHDVNSPVRFVTWMRQLLMPILSSALGKVDRLAVSMEGRSFGRYPQRTFLKQRPFARRDSLALGALIVTVTGVLIAIY
ncbi:MAG: energy-coupling factor transporter transmembrane component T family protein [Anaerolineae bacterium]